jgi:arylsulfatase A-like enzyme
VITGYKWELYNVMEDPTQSNDLAAKMPDKLKQMQGIFYVEAPSTTCCRSTTRR